LKQFVYETQRDLTTDRKRDQRRPDYFKPAWPRSEEMSDSRKKRKLGYGDDIKDYWIVLEEIPETLEGWKVFFDEETKKFGLGGRCNPLGFVANFDDSFINAFKSM
jgi:hypothetical protein